MVEKVFVNGTFDILHPGHIRLLSFAKSLGKKLYIAIDSDRRVSELKGTSRPINTLEVRKEMLLALKSVDGVMDFDSDIELSTIIKSLSPDIMVVGSDYIGKCVIGSEFAKQILFFKRINEYSTTNKIQSIINR